MSVVVFVGLDVISMIHFFLIKKAKNVGRNGALVRLSYTFFEKWWFHELHDSTRRQLSPSVVQVQGKHNQEVISAHIKAHYFQKIHTDSHSHNFNIA